MYVKPIQSSRWSLLITSKRQIKYMIATVCFFLHRPNYYHYLYHLLDLISTAL